MQEICVLPRFRQLQDGVAATFHFNLAHATYVAVLCVHAAVFLHGLRVTWCKLVHEGGFFLWTQSLLAK